MGAYVVGVLILGLAFSGKQESLREYFLASGELPWWAVSLSLYATTVSPLSFLGVAGWIFLKDSRWAVGGAVLGIGTMALAMAIWVPLWGRLRPLSIYEYLENRFHPGLRAYGGAIFPISMLFWVGNGLVTSSMAFEVVTGLPVEYCLVGIVALGTIYTMLGGARAVIWTDVAQAVVFLFAYLVLGVLLLQYFDWQPMKIYNIASSVISEETGHPKTTVFSAQFSLAVEATIWAILFSKLVEALMFGSSQVRVQRLLAAGGTRNMVKTMFGLIGVDLIFMVMAVAVAWGFIAYYEQNLEAKALIEHADQVMVHYIGGNVPILVRGVILAGLLAAMMSTFDSALNSMSSVTINDFYRRYMVRDQSEAHYVSISRYVTLVWGVMVLAFALWQLKNADSTVLERVGKLNILVLPSISTCFVLGVFTKRCNTLGVVIGGLAAMALALSFSGFPGLMNPWVDPEVFTIDWIWLDGLCTATGLLVGYLASLLFPRPAADQLQGLTIWDRYRLQ